MLRSIIRPITITHHRPLFSSITTTTMATTATRTYSHLASTTTPASPPIAHPTPPAVDKTLSSRPTARLVNPNDTATLTKCIRTLSSAFASVPCTNAFAAESSRSVHAYVDETVRSSMAHHNGVLLEAGSASAVALWELPYSSFSFSSSFSSTLSSSSNPSTNFDGRFPPTTTQQQQHQEEGNEGVPGRIKKEWQTVIRRAKEKYIGTDFIDGQKVIRPHYHLDFLGRDPDVTPKVKGAISAVVLPYLARAQQDRLSVWLEATSEEVMRLYLVYGFRVLEEITVGRGVVDGRGRMVNKGKEERERKGEAEGVRAWLMLVDNHENS